MSSPTAAPPPEPSADRPLRPPTPVPPAPVPLPRLEPAAARPADQPDHAAVQHDRAPRWTACRSSTGSRWRSSRSGILCTLAVHLLTRRAGRGGRRDDRLRRSSQLVVFLVLFIAVAVMGFMASRWRRVRGPRPPRRVGARRADVRVVDHLVPAGRGPLHRLHVRRDPGAAVLLRRAGLLRGALHDHRVPAGDAAAAADVVGLAGARLRDPRRLRARALRLPAARAGDRDHRHRRDDALHRPAARRARGGAADHRAQRLRASGATRRCSWRSSCSPPTPTSPGCGPPR